MEKLKNIIFVKDIKSNLVEEAIIVFKENVKIKEKQYKAQNSNKIESKSLDKNYYLKEAEHIINNYINDLENRHNGNKIKMKFKLLQVLNIILVITLLVVLIFKF